MPRCWAPPTPPSLSLLAKRAAVGWADQFSETALHVAARGGHAEIIRALGGTQGAAIDAQNNGGCTSLHLAAYMYMYMYHDKTATAQALLSLGASTSVRNQAGKTALEQADVYGNHECVQQLLRDLDPALLSSQRHGAGRYCCGENDDR